MKWLILALVIVVNAWAVEPEDRVVKVESHPCAEDWQSPQTRKGSGVLVEKGGRYFVVTSGHVPFQTGGDDSTYCHRVSSPKLGALKANLRAALFTKDLALLEIVDKSALLPTVAIPWTALPVSTALAKNDRVDLMGFAFAVDGNHPPSGWVGHVGNERSPQTPLQLDHVIEVEGSSQYGMSGGGMFNRVGDWVGVLSHHQLRIRIGEPTTWQTRGANEDGTAKLITIAIPVSEVRAWWENVDKKDPASDLRLEGGVGGEHLALVMPGILFEEINCQGPTGNGGTNGGIGGGHGVGHRTTRPIGGGQTAGGGLSAEVPCQIRISSSTRQTSNGWPYRASILSGLRSELAKQSPLYLNWLSRDSVTVETDSLLSVFNGLAAGFEPKTSPKRPEQVEVRPDDLGAQGAVMHQKVLDFMERNKDRMIRIAAGMDKMPGEEIRSKWQQEDAINRMWLYWIYKDLGKNVANRALVFRLANKQVIESGLQWLSEVKAGQQLPAWQKRDEGERMWVIGSSYYLYDNWSRVDASTQRLMWEEASGAMARALLAESLLLRYRERRELGELESLMAAYDRQFSDWWRQNDSSTHASEWPKLSLGQKWWFFHSAQGDTTMSDEIRRLNGGGNISLVALFPAIDMPVDR